jgi:phosphate starvation-inducible PhoH-like protein
LKEARSILSGIEGVGMIQFSEVDVVRHPLVQRIVVAYEKRDQELEAERRRQAEERQADRERTRAAAIAAVQRVHTAPPLPEPLPANALESQADEESDDGADST